MPHFQPEGKSLFITFRLYGTLPFPNGRDGRSFDIADRELERSTLGADWLKRPDVAACVTRVLQEGEHIRGFYELIAYVVMPNHVHLLLDPKAPVPKLMQYVKGVSAIQANRMLGRTGPFWQTESFDRWVRSADERKNIVRYIEFNPVRAGIVAEPDLFPYSSACESFLEPAEARSTSCTP